MKVAWVCDICDWLTVSYSKEQHTMDTCKCGECAIDLEEYYMRRQGSPRSIAKLDIDKWRHVRK